MAAADALRTRRSFARLKKTLDVPNLIDIQRRSFEWLTDPVGGGLRETIDDISPIEDYTGHLAVQFGEFVFDQPELVPCLAARGSPTQPVGHENPPTSSLPQSTIGRNLVFSCALSSSVRVRGC